MTSFNEWLEQRDERFHEYFDTPYDSNIVGQNSERGYSSSSGNPVLDSGKELPARFNKMSTMYRSLAQKSPDKSQFAGSLKVRFYQGDKLQMRDPRGDQKLMAIELTDLGKMNLDKLVKGEGQATHIAGETIYKKGESRPMQMTAKDILNNVFGECKALLQYHLIDEKATKFAKLNFINEIKDIISRFGNNHMTILDASLKSIIRDLESKNGVQLKYQNIGVPSISLVNDDYFQITR